MSLIIYRSCKLFKMVRFRVHPVFACWYRIITQRQRLWELRLERKECVQSRWEPGMCGIPVSEK